MREILIKRGGFTRPGCSFFGDPVNESYEGGSRRRGVCFLLKPEIKKSDRPNAAAMSSLSSAVDFSLSLRGVKVGPRADLHC